MRAGFLARIFFVASVACSALFSLYCDVKWIWNMPENLLPALLIQIFAVGFTPGPANIYALTMAVKHGRAKALKMWLGLLAGASVAVCLMALLTHFLGEALGGYVVWLKYLGAAYIVYLAYQVWKSGTSGSGGSRDCSFFSGMTVQLTNGKILLFELSVFGTFVLPYSSNLADLLPVAALLLVAGPGANLFWLLAGSFMSGFLGKYHRLTDAVSAVALVLCAGWILFS